VTVRKNSNTESRIPNGSALVLGRGGELSPVDGKLWWPRPPRVTWPTPCSDVSIWFTADLAR